jgi:transcriptional regulator with XRE-family HTH domain
MSTETSGERLQRLRKAAGLSQPGLAKAAGVPAATIRNWEQGRRGPLLENAAKLAVALGVSLDELAGLTADGAEKPRGPRKGK